MISGVLLILLGEAVLIGSPWLLVWWGLFLIFAAITLPRIEEPALLRRCGTEYEDYRSNVPMWLPRRTPWDPPAV